jgi:hypothetical protein
MNITNLKQMAQTLIYLQEHGLDDYALLRDKSSAASARFNELSDRIKELDAALAANAELQKHIVTYSKTRNTYAAYRARLGIQKSSRKSMKRTSSFTKPPRNFLTDSVTAGTRNSQPLLLCVLNTRLCLRKRNKRTANISWRRLKCGSF